MFVRRYVLLDRDNRTYEITKDKLLEVEAPDINTANQNLIEEIDRIEGTAAVIPDGGRTTNGDPYIGWYADRDLEYPQLSSLDRMNCVGERFDYIFYTWGGINYGENDRYLYMDGIVCEPCSGENGIWHFTATEEQLHLDVKLFRTDDANFILYSAVEDIEGVLHFPVVVLNSSSGFIYSRALKLLEYYPSSRSKAFINNLERVLRIKHQLKAMRMKKVPANILTLNNAYYSKDSIFGANARLLQCIWREKNGHPVQPGKRGNYLEKNFARKEGKNFITENAWKRAQQAVKNKGDKLINEARFFENLLSSQPLCFNLFSELSINLDLSSQLFSKLFPERVKVVSKIDFEHSPGRGNEEYTGDGSAFDVFVEYVSPDGEKGFIAIEVKYAENLKDDPAANCFYLTYLETLVESLEEISSEPWIGLFKERYLEFPVFCAFYEIVAL